MNRQKKAAGKDTKMPNPLAGGRKKPLEGGKVRGRVSDMIAEISAAEKAVLEGKSALPDLFEVQDAVRTLDVLYTQDEHISVSIAVNDALENLFRNEKSRDAVVDALLKRLVARSPDARAEALDFLSEVFEGDDEEAKTFVIQKITAFMHSDAMIREMERNSPAYTRAAREIANLFDMITGKFNPTPGEERQARKRTLKALGLTEADMEEAEALLKGAKE